MTRGINGVYITDTLADESVTQRVLEEKKIIIPSQAKKVIARERVEDPKKVEMTQEVKARVNEGIQYLFNNTNADNFSVKANQISEELTDAIMNNYNVVSLAFIL